MIDYTVYFKDSVNDLWEERQTNVVGTSVTISDLNLGLTYTFQVKSSSAFDFSQDYSNEVSIYTATNPDQPAAPVTAIQGTDVVISWIAPNNRGLEISHYKIYIQRADPAYWALDLVNCDGSSQAIIDAQQCTIPRAALMASPFDL